MFTFYYSNDMIKFLYPTKICVHIKKFTYPIYKTLNKSATYLGWSSSISLGLENVFFLKVLGSILSGVNLSELI
jgi:hypothetical protein